MKDDLLNQLEMIFIFMIQAPDHGQQFDAHS